MSKATSIDICELIQENDLLFARYVEKDLLIVIILSGIVLHTCNYNNTSRQGAVNDGQENFVFYCSLCAFSSKTRDEVMQHMCLHDKKKRYICSKCNEKFINKSMLEKHLLSHADTDYFCEMCNKKFAEELLFKNHMEFHKVSVGLQAFVCNLCKAKFSNNSELKDHLRIHSEKVEFVCNVCNINCDSLYTLEIHSKLFNHPVGFHVCNHCGKSFSDLPSFLNHKKSHEFFCNFCHREFSEEKFLITHIKVHEKENVCDICKLRLPSSKDLEIHLKNHPPSFECPICKVKYRHVTSLDRHMLRKHK
ncbi:gastrula zinc finger protein XlCGF7.1-like isoform X1 [Argiope bruennichi]|uniref:gastrula zinc finger protein XlCGF7.1-like isoform X1 n=1 Tax=Argiope bruennichi TaxID=94029 RepID=UPI002493E16D|nr:gastrula zinc finger protein XlCGF7.1-like isoform X1 [Argiope bruennichi]XP_055941093.1 gastrula zinc finger protein XlCGF7.1-like isoform X1 [Argiope bruennichi]XP_055941094.1 gastrula zinc finger protein XlCGF7.1-like isoform X1 [Argiope bruennichi]XP_055941095.1 gastrula zinc finger protein XlCGF7.1-like isoform X1 [Argiope bruennichi]XP_055941096.1 gastrula zinc finger protein XlCGF7.1-like isoform X1 [Argiope bruennichi]XP_055941097.1 gastrula zinc finger protein XlCGF7.1-like isoform